jgi:hypothetical protein
MNRHKQRLTMARSPMDATVKDTERTEEYGGPREFFDCGQQAGYSNKIGKLFSVSLRLGFLALTLAFACTTAVAADAVALADKVTETGMQQRQTLRSFLELEQKVMRISARLQETDPVRAMQLREALDLARQKFLAGRMGSAAELLNDSKLQEARALQPGLTTDLEAMQCMLRAQPSEYDNLQKQLEQVQAWLDTTLELAQEQWRLARDSEKAQDAAAEKKRLSDQIASIENLLAAQKALQGRTEKAQASGQSQLDREVNEQKKLEQETRDLLVAIQNDGRAGPTGPTGQTHPTGPTSPSNNSGAGSARSTEQPPGPPAPTDSAAAPAGTRGPEAGEKPVAVALREQMLATENLTAQKPRAALTNQMQAVEKLEFALREIKYELGRQQKLDNQKAKAAQDLVEMKTAKLFEDMVQAENRQSAAGATIAAPHTAQAKNPNSLPGQQPSLNSPYVAPGSGATKPVPAARDISPDFARGFSTGGDLRPGGMHPQTITEGKPFGFNGIALVRPTVNEAEQLMLKAGKLLETNALVVAAPVQMDAYRKLAITAEMLEQWFQSTKDIQRDTLRPLLKELLETLLVKQQTATFRTVALHNIRMKGAWTDESLQELVAVRASEQDASRIAERALDLVIQDGSTIAFSGLLTELRPAFTNVIVLLGQEETGPHTQDMQREIEKVVASLIVATEQNIRNVSPEKVSNIIKKPRFREHAPLIPIGTELRLLDAQQVRINERTAAIEKEFQATGRKDHQAELLRLAEQQRKVCDMIKDSINKIDEAMKAGTLAGGSVSL